MIIKCSHLWQLTPKAFANFSPGLERSDNPGATPESLSNPERVNIAHA